AAMSNDRWALLVHNEEEPVGGVKDVLLSLGWRTRHSHSCSEARAALQESVPPAIVLTDTSLSDGTWVDVLVATTAAPSRTPLIVVSRLNDVRLYLDVLEKGAHDFIAPPITAGDLAYIITTATLKGPDHGPRKLDRNRARGWD